MDSVVTVVTTISSLILEEDDKDMVLQVLPHVQHFKNSVIHYLYFELKQNISFLFIWSAVN